VCIEDLESVNGTVINKQKISPRQPHPVHNGDEIRLGKMVLMYYSS
jgi:pSer/pThr/pTyr-binding forkhead associated (FHA) protein